MKQLSFSFKVGLGLLLLGLVFVWTARNNPNFWINTDQSAVVKQIKELQRLETTSFTIEKIISAGTTGSAFQQILFGDKILLIAHGNVIAGVDLALLQEQDITVAGSSVVVKLPPTEIFQSYLDESKTQVYDRSQGLLSKGDKDLESEARQAAETEILRAACEAGILEEAADMAETQLTTLLEALGFTEVEITAPAGRCPNAAN